MSKQRYSLVLGEGAQVAVALHAGHRVRPNLLDRFALTEIERLYEEDPGTDLLAEIAPSRLISHISRFEHDLNRPREKAVYQRPDDAWGLTVWKPDLPHSLVDESLRHYDEFYAMVEKVLQQKLERHGTVLVLDLHSYNHRRSGPGGAPSDSIGNPTIEIDTTVTNRKRLSEPIDILIASLRDHVWRGESLDVRENIRFKGPGHFARWVEANFNTSVCVVSIEVKKVYMNEWTGEIDRTAIEELGAILNTGITAIARKLLHE